MVLQLAGELRRVDPDRCLTVLAAPPPPQLAQPLLALYLLNAELARCTEVKQGPLLATLKLKWWHDALDEAAAGRPREQPVLQALAAPLAERRLPMVALQSLIELRLTELEERPFADLEAMARHASASGGRLNGLAARLLGGGDGEIAAAEHVGTAFALIGLLRAAGHHAALGRQLLPADALDRAQATFQSLREGRDGAALAPLARMIAARAAAELVAARRRQPRLPGRRAAPFLLAPLVDGYLRRLANGGFDPFTPGFVRRAPGGAWRLLAHRLKGRT
ncbi:MAG TPA: squalene/phytoene synthase family protein [Kiloniellales bacterium]|nr:squalene/phytoene synthase family protein [Kiloniellales bacterium]